VSLRTDISLYFFLVERLKHDLEPIHVPELVCTDIKLEDSKQSTSKEPLFSSQTTMNNWHCKRPRMKNLSELNAEEMKRCRVVKYEGPELENKVKILEVRKGTILIFLVIYILELLQTRKSVLLWSNTGIP
jgi:hypothetical protein